MKQLVVFFVIMLLVLTPSCKWLKEKGWFGKKADTMTVWLARQDSIRVVDSVKKAQEALMAREQALLDSLQRAEDQTRELENRFRYNIIVGSFITPEYARSWQAEFKSRGYDAKILALEGTSFEMVSAEAHENFSQAVERLKRFQDTVVFDAWMYIRR
jgi:hypothetical protein